MGPALKQSEVNRDGLIPATWTETTVPAVLGAYLITFPRHRDDRGYFQEVFSSVRYDCNLPHVAQVNVASSRRNVVRGLHVAGFGKLCTVVRGRAFDVVADVRRESPTRGNWYGAWLDDENCTQLYVPAGCAHGYFAAADDTLFLYQQDGLHRPGADGAVHWRDPALNIAWPEAEYYVLSDKDRDAKEWTRA